MFFVVLQRYQDGLEYNKTVLKQYMECQYGLLQQLKNRQVFTSQQLTDIKCLNKSPQEQNKKLLELMRSLEDRKQVKELCSSFSETKQSHLLPYITGYLSMLYDF